MKPAPLRYRRVATVDEAVAALAAAPGTARVLAGGQSLVQELSARTTSADTLVDIGRLPLAHIAVDADVVRVGALCTITAVERDAALAAALPALAEAAARIAYPAVRNRGTVGGNVAHADPASGIPPVLLAHDGEVVLAGPSGERTVTAAEYLGGPRAADELVTELRFRRPGPRSGSSFAEVSRRVRGWGLAGACVVVELAGGGSGGSGGGDSGDGTIAALRIGLLGLAPTAVRAGAAEAGAVGRTPDAVAVTEIADAAVADLRDVPVDVHASAALRRSLGRVCVRRALTEAVGRAVAGPVTRAAGA